jgi:hypothetical protein
MTNTQTGLAKMAVCEHLRIRQCVHHHPRTDAVLLLSKIGINVPVEPLVWG